MPVSGKTHGVSVRIFLPNGSPEGLRIVEKSNWTGRALMCSRTEYPDVRKRNDFDRPGVYVLLGPAEKEASNWRVYVGEADVARIRLDMHLRGKDFWTHLILFTSKDENLNKAHVKYLESRLVDLAHRAKRSEVENVTVPQPPSLSEADRADADAFLDDMLLIYPLLGVSTFEVTRKKGVERGVPLQLAGKGAKAEGRDTPEGFIVFKGAIVRPDTVPSILPYQKALRDRLIEQQVIVPEGESLVLVEDYVFTSPTTAAAVVMGRNANGRIEWKDPEGRTLKQIQEAAITDNP